QHINKIDPSKYPTAKLVYDLFSRHVDLKDFSWLACVGLIGDNQREQWREFVELEAQRHGMDYGGFFGIVSMISAVEVLAPKKLGELLVFLANCHSPQEALSSKYYSYRKKLDVQVDGLLREFEEKKEVHEKIGLVWFEFESNNNIKSAVINRVSNELYPDKTVIFVQSNGTGDGFVSFSARRQDFRVKTNELLEKAVEGFVDAGAGGHIPAAAGRIKKEDLVKFKQRVLALLSKNQG
ncbi:MAG: DHH family phosphoesterase, partial [archaeon]|nr:DHH family phosphoesterase [archaeon]